MVAKYMNKIFSLKKNDRKTEFNALSIAKADEVKSSLT
jgi:hypothetical protein